MGKIIGAAVYKNGKKLKDITLEESGTWAKKPGHFVWIGLYEPDEPELRLLQQQFGLHGLALEDALKAHQRPKLEAYENTTFLVLRTAFMRDEHIAMGETEIFIGSGYIITVRHGESASYDTVRKRVESSPHQLKNGEDYILYAIIDFVVDNYLVVVDKLTVDMETLEETILLPPMDERKIARIYELRRELQRLKLAVAPTAEVCRRLENVELPGIDPEFRPYYRDIVDHLNRGLEQVDTLREALSFAFEASLLTEASRQGVITRRLTGWAAILAVPTAIAGIYGMNFKYMPELDWQYGYYAVLGIITLICAVLFMRFRKAGWL